jgi:uncharacterized protein YmfQ (DUF2313 family)
MIATEETYAQQLVALQPKGAIWPTEPTSLLHTFFASIGAVLATLHNRLLVLIEEADPRTTIELLAEWERLLGLPDDCWTNPETLSLQVRRNRVVQKLTVGGGQSRAFYTSIAEALGYEITITEPSPHNWTVTVAEPRVTYFRTGESKCGDSLGLIDRTEDLECVLQASKPAHSRLLVAYTGA